MVDSRKIYEHASKNYERVHKLLVLFIKLFSFPLFLAPFAQASLKRA